jgi:hypothetical protein
MAGNDEAVDSKPPEPGPLSLDDAERLASQFTPLWEEAPEATAAPVPEPAGAAAPPPAQASPFADLKPVQMTPPEPVPDVAPESTPAMVAIARPMGSSPDIDPTSTELPDRRSDYAPPRPLAVPQRTMVGLAPPPPVQVAPSATTTPLGLASPRPSRPALEVVAEARPALQVVAEPSGLGLEPAADRSSDTDVFPARRKRKTGLVLGVMGVAAALVAAVGIRSLFVKQDASVAASAVEPARRPEPVRAVAAPPPVEQAAPPAPPIAAASAEPAAPAAPAVSGENSAVAAAPSPGGIQLAATRQAAEAPSAKQPAEGAKPRAPQRVEEAKHASRPPAQPRRPRTESAPKPRVSPPLPGAGAIVRQSPF